MHPGSEPQEGAPEPWPWPLGSLDRGGAVGVVAPSSFAGSAHGLERLAAGGGKDCPVVRDEDLQLLSFA